MKFRIFISALFLSATLCASAQKKADTVTLSQQGAFSMIMLPDVQNYVKYDYNQPILELMTAWVAENIENLDIRAVMCTGDLVDQNESLYPLFPRFGNLTGREQWEFAAHAFGRMDNKVPYIISTGNHDYGYTRAETDMTRFPEYFPVEKNSCWKKCLVSVCNNRHGYPTLENAAFEFTDPVWGKLLIITLEFAPRDYVLTWAKELAASDTYGGHKVFVITHSYLGGGADAQRLGKEGYKISPANSGQEIWDKLIYPSDNIRLVLCGHYAKADEDMCSNVGFRSDKNHAGKDVAQMMFNTQALGGGMSGNGGDGWLRLLEFMPDGQTVKVRTYSPLFGFSPTTVGFAWCDTPCGRFDFFIK